jgi:polar amino acid transport system permease protein
MARIVLPQATRVIIPAIGNQVILVLKGSSIVSVIGGGDLLTAAQNIYSMNYEVIPMLFVATFWYMVLIAIFGVGQRHLEARYDFANNSRLPAADKVDEGAAT